MKILNIIGITIRTLIELVITLSFVLAVSALSFVLTFALNTIRVMYLKYKQDIND